MGKRMGHSLAGAVKVEESFARNPKFSPSVLKVLAAVFSRPGASLNMVSGMSGFTRYSTRKHLEIAVEQDYIVEAGESGKHYFPRHRVTEEHYSALAAAANTYVDRLLCVVVDRPGVSVGEVISMAKGAGRASYDSLVGSGLVSLVHDGKFIRVFPSPMLDSLNSVLREREAITARHAVKYLLRDGFDASMHASPGGSLIIDVDFSSVSLHASVTLPYGQG